MPDAVVAAPTLNVRSGPGTAFASVGSLEASEALVVLGQSNNCTWLKIRSTQGLEGWVAANIGDTVYTSLNLPCDTIPVLVVPTPTSAPQPTPTSPPVAQPTAPPAAANLGCYLIQNQMGVELMFTFTAQDWNWNESFQVPADAEQEYCLSPGRYTYTVDAPPPWSSINGELQVEADDRFLWPIRGER
jgi:serine protease Do